jgi:hypothetical protein
LLCNAYKLCFFIVLICSAGFGQQPVPLASQCPIYSSLATTKVRGEDMIVIWFWNQGSKTTHGAEFRLVMLDAAGNRYPSSKRYVVTGKVRPQRGDFVSYSAKPEQEQFGANWENIEGIEVYVVSVMFADATTWKPMKGSSCKTAFISANYDREIERIFGPASQAPESSRKKIKP